QILGGKGQPGKRPAQPPLNMDARTGHKGIDVVFWHVGPQRSDGIGGPMAICTPKSVELEENRWVDTTRLAYEPRWKSRVLVHAGTDLRGSDARGSLCPGTVRGRPCRGFGRRRRVSA